MCRGRRAREGHDPRPADLGPRRDEDSGREAVVRRIALQRHAAGRQPHGLRVARIDSGPQVARRRHREVPGLHRPPAIPPSHRIAPVASTNRLLPPCCSRERQVGSHDGTDALGGQQVRVSQEIRPGVGELYEHQSGLLGRERGLARSTRPHPGSS